MSTDRLTAFRPPFTGSVVRSSYVERHLTVYGIHEYEAESLSNLSTVATLAFSLGSLFLSVPIGIYISWAFADHLSARAGFTTELVAPAFLVATVIFYFFGAVFLYQRRGLWDRIKDQSVAR
jgi:ABC-type sugar transport system permease subunit